MTVADDPYIRLEDIENPENLSWVRAQNAVTQAELEASPDFEPTRELLERVLNSREKIPYVTRHGAHHYNFWQDEVHVRGIWRRTTLDSYRTDNPAWDTVIDLDALATEEGENWVWKGAQVLEPEANRALVQLSRGGGDAVVVREFDLETNTFVADGFVVPEGKSWLGWRTPESLFIGTDFGPGSLTTSGYPRIVKHWQRGTRLEDAPVVFEGQTDDVWAYGYADRTPGFEREFVVRGKTFFTNDTFLVRGETLVRLGKPDDAPVVSFREFALIELKTDWHVNATLYPQGSLLAIDFDAFLAGSTEFTVLYLPDEHSCLIDYATTQNFVLLNVLENVRHTIYAARFTDGAWHTVRLEAPEFGTVSVYADDNLESDAYWMSTTDFLTPSSLSFVPSVAQKPEVLKRLPAYFDASGLQTRQFEAASTDGTRVPYFVVSRKDIVLDGSNPTLLYGYGGFEVPMLPSYSAGIGAWVEKGGVYVLANIRGGGEFGPRWHRTALRENRQRAYDDFIAVAEDLIGRGLTSSRHLGIQGGSNGGLLMGAMLTQRPELFRAVVCQVPLLDMKRYHLLLAGASWMEEYGNPDVPEDWAFMSRYSPYQNLKPTLENGARYPRVLFTTSTRDDRVHPGHARKMYARMKEYGHDALYFENIEGGHGGAANNAQIAYMNALAYTFLWNELR